MKPVSYLYLQYFDNGTIMKLRVLVKFYICFAVEGKMSSNTDYDYSSQSIDYNFDSDEDEIEESEHRKDVRRRLEAKLERKRLKAELEDYEGELDSDFDWDDVDN